MNNIKNLQKARLVCGLYRSVLYCLYVEDSVFILCTSYNIMCLKFGGPLRYTVILHFIEGKNQIESICRPVCHCRHAISVATAWIFNTGEMCAMKISMQNEETKHKLGVLATVMCSPCYYRI